MLFIDNFNGDIMNDFSNISIPDFRKIIAATLIKERDNKVSLVELMNAELQF